MNSKQKWKIGEEVKVEFMSGFTVIDQIQTKVNEPNEYILKRGEKFYRVIPQSAIVRIEVVSE